MGPWIVSFSMRRSKPPNGDPFQGEGGSCAGLNTTRAGEAPAPGPASEAARAAPGSPEWRAPRRVPSGRHRHTATGPPPLIERVTVTLPIHPLKGVALPVARFIRSQDGRRYVDVEHPPGQYMRLPLEWTDRSPPLVPPSVGGREVRLSVPALLELAQAVQAALEQRRGSPVVPTPAASPTLRPARSTSRRGKGRALKR
jgi:hypothetical protein